MYFSRLALSLRNKKVNKKIIGGQIMNTLLLIGPIGTPEIIIIALAILLLFGGKKIPELMKGIGKGIRNFKEGVKGVEDDIKLDDTNTTPSTTNSSDK